MTERCDLCGRGMAEKQLTPTWWIHGPVCRRKGCKEAVKDAINAVEQSRDRLKSLIGAVAARKKEQYAPVGYRDDTMAEIDMSGETWWATEVVKQV